MQIEWSTRSGVSVKKGGRTAKANLIHFCPCHLGCSWIGNKKFPFHTRAKKMSTHQTEKKWRLGLDVILSGLHKVPLENLIKLNNFSITSSLSFFFIAQKTNFPTLRPIKAKAPDGCDANGMKLNEHKIGKAKMISFNPFSAPPSHQRESKKYDKVTMSDYFPALCQISCCEFWPFFHRL